MEWHIRAGLQSADVEYLGNRRVEFKDGGVITHDYPEDKIYGLFIGAFGQQMMKKITLRDEANDITATLEYGAYMFKK
jgi:hypothetical protein